MPDLPSSDKLIARLFVVYGVNTAYALTQKLAADSTDPRRYTERKVSRWAKGENSPEFDTTVEMLELAGWLSVQNGEGNATARSLRRMELATAALADDLERLQAALSELR